MASAASCPVCLQRFDAPSVFALHVSSCTVSTLPENAASTASVAAPTASCPMCHMVYTSVMAAHDIEFHEEECERYNEEGEPLSLLGVDLNGLNGSATSGAAASGAGAPSSGAKRTRDSVDVSAANATAALPSVKLFPSFCAVCDGGGRTLLHCAGKCARSFHPLCIEEINLTKDFKVSGSVSSTASSSSSGGGSSVSSSLLSAGGSALFASTITRDKKAQKQWVCGECTRGLHTCQLCGFLGHESHELIACSLTDCGFFFHPKCLQTHNYRMQSPLVCPRHTCDVCHAMETDLASFSSCTKCCKGAHIRCRDTTVSTTPTRGRGDVFDANFHVCDQHKPASDAASPNLTEERKYAQFVGLKMNSRPGDIVLILEYGNLLLPSSAKEAAPLAFNQWGIVQRVENLGDGISPAWWTQLLTVMLFSDDSTISVANRYVLPLTSMKLYASPTLMVRDAIQGFTMSETNLRYLERRQPHSTAINSDVAYKSTLFQLVEDAFRARMDALDVSPSSFTADATRGFTAWQIYVGSASRSYADTKAPVYIALDTRGRSRSDEGITAASERAQRSAAGGSRGDADGDVDMDYNSSSSSQGRRSSNTSTGKTSGSVPFRSAASTALVANDVMDVMAALIQGVETLASMESLVGERSSPIPELASVVTVTESTQDVINPLYDQGEDEAMAEIEISEEPVIDSPLSIVADTDPVTPELRALTPVNTPSSSPPHSRSVMDRIDLLPSKKRVLDQKSADMERTVLFGVMDSGDAIKRGNMRLPKKMKLFHIPVPIHVQFTVEPILPNKPSGSIFSSGVTPPTTTTARPSVEKQSDSAKVDEMGLLNIATRFLDAEASGRLPKRTTLKVRPTFYRPAPFLYRGPSIGRGVENVSRILLCQDKRNLKCYVKKTHTAGKACPRQSGTSLSSVEFITVDLAAISSMRMLEHEVCDQIWSVEPRSERSTGWHWQSLVAKRDVPLPKITLSYCTYDGMETAFPSRSKASSSHSLAIPSPQHQNEWLCFCANVVHLTATVTRVDEAK